MMRANDTKSAQMNFSSDRQKDHQRQQDRLKAMAATSDKTQMVSADVMIENLLKDFFKKLPQTPSPVNQFDHSDLELPLWLQCESAAVPAQYKYLWSLVQSTMDLADTQKVSQLLLTSGLQIDVLGFIWNLANKTIPGQLTKQEFYIVLALVSLAQTGYKFNNLSILKLITVPSIPVLQVGLQKHPIHQPYALQNTEAANFNSHMSFLNSSTMQCKPFSNTNETRKDKEILTNSAVNEIVFLNDSKKSLNNQKQISETNLTQTINRNKTLETFVSEQTEELSKNLNFPCISSSSVAELEDDFSAFQSVTAEKNEHCESTNHLACDFKDDFTDFQSASVKSFESSETALVNQKREIPKIPLPKAFTGKLTNLKPDILKISLESEQKLKVLPPAESLSSLPESKISSDNKVSTSISLLGSNHGIGSRLANHSFNTKLDRPKCHKHHKIKLNPIAPVHSSKENEIFLEVKHGNLESSISKCCPKTLGTCKTFILKETKIKSSENAESSSKEQLRSESDFSLMHSGENTRQIEIPMLGTLNETLLPTQSNTQMSNFDLINVQEDKYNALREIDLTLNQELHSGSKEVNDDFGDFLSADIPKSSAFEISPVLVETSSSNPDLLSLKDEEKEDWGDWNFNTESSSRSISGLDTSRTDNISDLKESSTLKAGNDLFDSFTLLTLNAEGNKQTYQSDSYSPVQQDYLTTDPKGDNLNDVLIFEMKTEKPDNLSVQPKIDETLNRQSDNEFWEFLSSDIKHPDDNSFSRHSSLPNLDLKVLPTNESEQETVWRKCLDSCHALIQEGYEIFSNISTKSILDEVFAASETEDYLNYLYIVVQISKRVTQNFSNFPSTQTELEKFWTRLQDLCFEYNIKLKLDEDNYSEGKSLCNICLKYIGCDVINQGSSSYHPSCANLWINCVEPTLPFSI